MPPEEAAAAAAAEEAAAAAERSAPLLKAERKSSVLAKLFCPEFTELLALKLSSRRPEAVSHTLARKTASGREGLPLPGGLRELAMA
jgi:hypothetical protein